MINKIKEHFKGKNPYILASFAVVLASILIIFALLQEEQPAGSIDNVVITEQIPEQSDEPSETIIEKESQVESGISEAVTEEDTDEYMEETELETVTYEEKNDETIEPEKPVISMESSEAEEESEVPEVQIEEPTNPDSDETEPKGESEPETKVPPESEPKESEESQAHEHSWIFESFYQDPTCSNGGLENQICAHCGETQTTIGTPTGKHIYEVESAGDCCSAEVIICVECNHREVRELDPKNHIDEEDGFCYGCGQKTE